MTVRLAALALVLMLPACAATSVPWQNPSVPEAQWSRDWSSCRRWAENQIGYRESDSPTFRDYDRANAKRQADALAGSCMRDRGYVPAPRRK